MDTRLLKNVIVVEYSKIRDTEVPVECYSGDGMLYLISCHSIFV